MTAGLRLAVTCVAAGLLVIAGLAIAMTGEGTATTVLPYLLVGGCAGTGLVAFGASWYRVERRREDADRVEDAVARTLRAAAELTSARKRFTIEDETLRNQS